MGSLAFDLDSLRGGLTKCKLSLNFSFFYFYTVLISFLNQRFGFIMPLFKLLV